MRAMLTVVMDRAISKKHYISPGGYYVKIKEKKYGFDFNESCGWVDANESNVIHFELKNEDCETFPEINELRKRINMIDAFEECYIYTGEIEDLEINPINIREFIIEEYNEELRNVPISTEFIKCETFDATSRYIRYVFTRKLLDTCKFFA